MSKNKKTHRTRRLNLRAFAIIGILILVSVPAFVGLKFYREAASRKLYLAEARKRYEEKKSNLALDYLNNYLERQPGDLEAIALKAKILAETAVNESQALEAARYLSQVVAATPAGKLHIDTHRELVKTLLKAGTQVQLAEQEAAGLLKEVGESDAEAHRLHGQALVARGKASSEKGEYFKAARKEFEAVEALEPGDVANAEQLATLFSEQLSDNAEARKVLDNVVLKTEGTKEPAKHAAALLARYRHHRSMLRNPDLKAEAREKETLEANADVDAAVKAAPDEVEPRIAAAEHALEPPLQDTAAARVHLAAIPQEKRADLRVKYLEGLIGLAELHPDDAVNAWRAGLLMSGGTDDLMTWRLANLLLESGRVDEALPLVDQYRRLTGGGLRDAKRRDNLDANYHYLNGVALLRRNRLDEAIKEFEAYRYKAEKQLVPRLDYQLGVAYEATQEKEKAREVFRAAADNSPDWSAPWTALARLEAQSAEPGQAGGFTQAIKTLERGLALMPNDPRLVATLAEMRWREQVTKPVSERNWTETKNLLQKYRELLKGSPELALVEADYLTTVRQPEDAIALLKDATKLRPRVPELWLALANALARQARLAEALESLERAALPENVGPNAGIAITRATFLIIKGQVKDARSTLNEAIEKVPSGQKPLLYKTLGDFYVAQKDYTSARAAYESWVQLVPKNPEPRLSLFQLAMATGDEASISRSVEDLKQSGDEKKGYHWRYAQVLALLRPRPAEKPDQARDAKRFEEAEALAAEIKRDHPQLALGDVLEAEIADKRKQIDKAINAYERALKKGAGSVALTPLLALLVRENRKEQLDRLSQDFKDKPGDFNRLAALQALKIGKADRAEELAERAAKGDPDSVDVRLWQAEVFKQLGKPKEAEEALIETIRKDPRKPGPWLSLLMLQVSQRRTADAMATVEKLRQQVESENKDSLVAQCYRAIGDMPKADQAYREALRKDPNNPNLLRQVIQFYEQTGRRDEAETELRALHRRQPNDGWTTRKLALSLASHPGNQQAWDEALSLVGPESRPDDIPADLITRAEIYSRGPEAVRGKAVAILEKLLTEVPNDAGVHEQVGRILFGMGDLTRAREHAAKGAPSEAATPDSIVFYTGVLLACNEVDEAEKQLRRIEAVDPDGLAVTELRARILKARGNDEAAAKALEKAFTDRSSTPEGLAVGRTIVNLLTTLPLRNLPAAERVARGVAKLSTRGRCILAEVLADEGKVDDAIAELDAAAKAGDVAAAGDVALKLAARPGADGRWVALAERLLTSEVESANPNADRILQLALLRHLKGDFEKEIAAYEQARTVRPTSFHFLNNMAWTLSEDLKRPDEALKCVDEAIRRVGPIPQVLDTRGVILTRLGRLDEAAKDLETATKTLNDPSLHYHLARLYYKMGRADDARRERDLALKANLSREQLQPCDRADWDVVMK